MQKKTRTERLVWIDLMLTLLSLELMSYFYYGTRSLALAGVCVSAALISEILSLRVMKKRFTADDMTCTSDALIIALMLPAVMDYKIGAAAVVFAVVCAKNIFGGRRNMIFSPAAAAYVFVLTSWGRKMLLYPAPHDKTGIFENAEDLISSASYLYNTTGKVEHSDFELLLGNFSGPAGAVSILLLMLAAVILIFQRDISAGAFLGTITGTAVLAMISPVSDSRSETIKYVFAFNMILFAAIYVVADKRIAPKKQYFAFFYGLFIGIFSYILLITTAQENVIVIVSVLFTPIALAFKNLEKKIADANISSENDLVTDDNSGPDMPIILAEDGELPVIEGEAEVSELIKELSETAEEGIDNE